MIDTMEAIKKAYKVEPHGFVLGCGRDTLAHWINTVTGERIPSNKIRRVLMDAKGRGEVSVGKSSCGYTTFTILDGDK